MSTVERDVEPLSRLSLAALAAELANLERRISAHRKFLARLNARLARRANLGQDQSDSSAET